MSPAATTTAAIASLIATTSTAAPRMPAPRPSKAMAAAAKEKEVVVMPETLEQKPWWRRGGILRPGQRFNIHAPGFFLAYYYSVFPQFCIAWLGYYLLSKYVCQMKTETCLYSMSSYLVSAVMSFLVIGRTIEGSLQLFALVFVISTVKVAVCSSACLHRYCAHTAYKTDSTIMKVFICIVGCLANQGGPIWWASQHRCHHKHCEQPDDPHSPTLVGFENAFAFFNSNPKLMNVNVDYVPPYLDEPIYWVIDTFYWAFCTLEMIAAWYCYGMPGMAFSYLTGIFCQLGGMYFNVIFHLSDEKGDGSCQGIDFGQYWTKVPVYYPGFFFLSVLTPFSAPFSGEFYHGIHHDQPQLAYRNLLDLGYWLFVLPLQQLGLIYDVYEAKKVL
jgi:fatty-acid desaturase